jgi:hypothetical protein
MGWAIITTDEKKYFLADVCLFLQIDSVTYQELPFKRKGL